MIEFRLSDVLLDSIICIKFSDFNLNLLTRKFVFSPKFGCSFCVCGDCSPTDCSSSSVSNPDRNSSKSGGKYPLQSL